MLYVFIKINTYYSTPRHYTNILLSYFTFQIYLPVRHLFKSVCVATPHPGLYLHAVQSIACLQPTRCLLHIKLEEPLVVRFLFTAFTSSTTLSEPFGIALSLKCFCRLISINFYKNINGAAEGSRTPMQSISF